MGACNSGICQCFDRTSTKSTRTEDDGARASSSSKAEAASLDEKEKKACLNGEQPVTADWLPVLAADDVTVERFAWDEILADGARQQELCKQLKELGFAVIAASRPARRAIGAVQNVTRKFFDSPEENRSSLAKIRYARGKLVGYLKRDDGAQFLEVHATTVEGLVVPEPKGLPTFGPAASRLHSELLQIGRHVLSWISTSVQAPEEALLQCIDRPGLEGLDEDDCGACVLRLCNYALCGTDVVFGEHTDASFLTVAPRSSAPGLQMWHRPTARWLDVENYMETGDIVIFVGDFVEVLTKGTFTAAMHRVVLKEGDASHRLSMPFLMRGQPSSVLNTVKYLETNPDASLMRVENMNYEELRLFLDLKGRKRMKHRAEAEESGSLQAVEEIDKMFAPSGAGGASLS